MGASDTLPYRRRLWMSSTVREMLFDDDEESNAVETAMKKFVPNYKLNPDSSKEVLNYQAIIKSMVQLDYVVRLLAAGLSFNQISRVKFYTVMYICMI